MNNVINLLLNHVSVRNYKNKPIHEDVTNTIIRCAQSAPTSSYIQSYSIIEVKSIGKRNVLFEVSGGQEWIRKAPLVLLFCGDLNRGYKYFEQVDEDVFRNTELFIVGTIDASLSALFALCIGYPKKINVFSHVGKVADNDNT